MENKQLICDLLLPTLQATDNLHDLVGLEYVDSKQVVVAKFATGGTKSTNVNLDSGTAMILDVVGQIV